MTTITTKQDAGNLSAVRVSYYADNKQPDIKLSEGQRLSILRYKTDKEAKTLRSSMAVILNRVTKHAIIHQTEKGEEFLQCLIDEVQDNLCKRCADKEFPFENVESADFMVKDYFDNTRTASGKRLTSELLGTYYDANMLLQVVERIVAKFPHFDTSKVEAVAKQYRQLWTDLSKYGLPHTKQGTELVAKLVSLHTFSEEDSELKEWAAERVKKLQDRHNAAEMLVDAI